jgi:hypothetical protein
MGLKEWIVENILGKKPQPKQVSSRIQRPMQQSSIRQTTAMPVIIEMEEKKEMKDTEKEMKGIDKKKMMEDYEKEKRIKEWPQIKDQIFQKYQIPIADDAKSVAEEFFGTPRDSISAFFITDERAVRLRYLDGGDKAIEEYADNLEKQAFVGAPITLTLLKRLNALKQAKNEGNVIDTEIDIDGFTPNGRIQYAIKDTDLDGQKIPSRRKFSPRCEMTATITEGFHVGPFVAYDELYFCTKEEMEQMIEKEKEGMGKVGMGMKEEKEGMGKGMKEEKEGMEGLCPHGSIEDLYCNQCDGDIVVSPSKKKVIGILLDVTGSMAGTKIARAKMAVKKVLEKMPVESNIDIVLTVFSTRFKEFYEDIIPYKIDYTQQIKEMAIEKVGRLDAEGDTPLYESVNRFLDETWINGALDIDKIFFPYTYLIIVSDGEENHSRLRNLIYRGKKDKDAFFAKLKAYRDSGLVTEIIPFAYGEGSGRDVRLVQELKDISGKMLVNETDPESITEALTSTVDSILYGSDNLKMMGMPVSGLVGGKKQKKPASMESM